ncbi:MAG TPA: transcription elongation factor GreA [Dehalococcoidia bacterium]|nr:transcription elongation factor GreA [Dehalococcoidia bacterium]
MSDKPVPLTTEGRTKIEGELRELHQRQKDVADRIHKAQELGTSQNDAEYEDAKNEQGMLQGRILEIKDILRRAVGIDEDSAHSAGRIIVGSGMEVEQDGKRRRFQIVGAPEADARQGKISNESPMGLALLGCTVGDTVDVMVPAGVIKVKVLKID